MSSDRNKEIKNITKKLDSFIDDISRPFVGIRNNLTKPESYNVCVINSYLLEVDKAVYLYYY